MILKSSGITKDKFFIPAFELNAGEIVIVKLFGGAHFYDLAFFLAPIFSGKIKHENVCVFKQMKYVERFIEPAFRRLFWPVTVGEYINKKAGGDFSIIENIFDAIYVKNNAHVNTLNGDRSKILSLYTALSHTKNIVFDLFGLDPLGATTVYEIVKQNVKQGGSAILLENFGGFENDCTKVITVEVLE